jgi:hypothetical protein
MKVEIPRSAGGVPPRLLLSRKKLLRSPRLRSELARLPLPRRIREKRHLLPSVDVDDHQVERRRPRARALPRRYLLLIAFHGPRT